MKTLGWLNDHDLHLDGVRFTCARGDYSLRSTSDRLILLKDRAMLEKYESELSTESIKNVFEFGIFQGGSPALFTMWFGLDKFVGVDVCQPVAALDDLIRKHELKQIRTYHGVSQADRPRIEGILGEEFGNTPLDLVIDDASHHYAMTRQAFEISFPWLRPGGLYIIEDWGWAHWQGVSSYKGHTALSKLVMELIMLCASRNDVVSEVRVNPSFVAVRKSLHAPELRGMSLDGLIRKRGIELVGSRDLNLLGVCKLISSRLTSSFARD